MAELELEIMSKDDGIALIRLEGFLDAHTFEKLDNALQDLLDEKVVNIAVNLCDVEYISSAGAGVFIGAMAQAKESGGEIVLVNPADNVQEVFDLLGVSHIFTILATDEEAKRELAKE